MTKKTFPLLILYFSISAFAPSVQAASYTYDQAHSRVEFILKHLNLVTVHGHFKIFSGKSRFDARDIENSEVTIEIKAASAVSGNKVRDGHLRSEKFFDAKKNPWIQFVSRKFVKINETRFIIEGDLTIRGIKRPAFFQTELLTHPGKITGKAPLSFTASTFIKRKDYQLGTADWSDPIMFLTNETLEIRLEVECFPA